MREFNQTRNDVVEALKNLIPDLEIEVESRRPLLQVNKYAVTKVPFLEVVGGTNVRAAELKVAIVLAESTMYQIYDEMMRHPEYAVLGVNIFDAHYQQEALTMDYIGRVSYRFILD